MTKEQIYEKAKATGRTAITWWWFKNYLPPITRYSFHKLCGLLVDDGAFNKIKCSGSILYEILDVELSSSVGGTTERN